MAQASRVLWELAVAARQNAQFTCDELITWVPGDDPVQAVKTFVKRNEIIRPENENIAADVMSNPEAISMTHLVCAGCNLKVRAEDIAFKNLVSLGNRLRTVYMGFEGVKPMTRSVKCSTCLGPKTPVQVLNEHVQKNGYELHMSMEVLVSAKDFAITKTCHWKLGENENAAKQSLAAAIMVMVRDEENRPSKKKGP